MKIYVIAEQIVEGLSSGDEGLEGVYQVELKEDMEMSKAASAAMDIFPDNIAMELPGEEYDMNVTDGTKWLAEDANHETGSMAGSDFFRERQQ